MPIGILAGDNGIMILSSSDILRILGSDAIIRDAARLVVVDGRPGLDIEEYVYVYIEKYPTIEEFEAVWKVWVVDNSGMGKLVLDAMTARLPRFDFAGDHYTVTEFASDKTVVKSEAEKQIEKLQAERFERQEDFRGLQKGLEERLGAVRDGRDGRDGLDGLDGRPGRDGRNGRDGRDIEATETSLFDLKDVEQSPMPFKKGQVLMFDGQGWTNLYVPQVSTFFSGGGSGGEGETVIISDTAPEKREDGSALQDGDQWWSSSEGRMHIYYVDEDSAQWVQSSGDGGTGIEDAPNNGQYYVRKYGEWVRLVDALAELGIAAD